MVRYIIDVCLYNFMSIINDLSLNSLSLPPSSFFLLVYCKSPTLLLSSLYLYHFRFLQYPISIWNLVEEGTQGLHFCRLTPLVDEPMDEAQIPVVAELITLATQIIG